MKKVQEINGKKIKHRYGGGMVAKRTTGGIIADIFIYAILAIAVLSCLLPLWHVLMASVSDPRYISIGKGTVGGIAWLPVGDTLNFQGYALLFENSNLLRGFFNTLFYMIGSTAIGMIINITGGYVLSRKSKLKPILTVFVMFTAIFNGGMMPTYAVIKGLHMTDTVWAMLIPGCTNAFFVVMISNAFAGVPEATVESAEIDGAGHLRIMLQILLPQSMTFVMVIILNSIVLQWNGWVNAALYLSNTSKALWPLQIWVRDFNNLSNQYLGGAGGRPNFDLYLIRYSVIIVCSMPMLIAFPFFQKQMEKGMMVGAVKG